MILLSGHGLSVEAMNEHREPSHPVRAAGRELRRWKSYVRHMQAEGEEIRGNPYKGDLNPGSGR